MTPGKTLVLAAALALLAAGMGCAHKKSGQKPAEVITAEEALRRSQDAMARHQLQKAKTILQKVQFTTAERLVDGPLVRLALADATYYIGDDLSLIEARSKYLDFVTLYGDHPRAPYAQFQTGMCSVKQIISATHDQAQTQTAIDDFAEIDKRWPNSPYARAARQFVAKGHDALAEHEFIIGTFYRKKKAYEAAVERYRALLETYPKYRNKDKVFYWLGWTLLQQRNDAQARVYLGEVDTGYPKSQYAPLARKLLVDSAKKEGVKLDVQAAPKGS